MFVPISILQNYHSTNSYFACLYSLSERYIFGISAYNSLKKRCAEHGCPHQSLSVPTAAFLYSMAGYAFNLGHAYVFWETAATIITLVLVGNLMEHRAVKRIPLPPYGSYKVYKPKLLTSSPLTPATGEEKIEEIPYKKNQSWAAIAGQK